MKFLESYLRLFRMVAALSFLSACSEPRVEFVLVQMNDTYEIAPHRPESPGGLARVSAIIKQLRLIHPNIYVLHAGDFLTPSSFSNFTDSSGQLLEGRQMVEVLNAMGIDFITFGNHEFDISEVGLLNRLDELDVMLLSNNCMHKTTTNAQRFRQRGNEIPRSVMLSDKTGQGYKLGLTATTLPYNRKSFVAYLDPFAQTRAELETLAQTCDASIVLTHQSRGDDSLMAAGIPGISLIMGGHEHFSFIDTVGQTFIAKADANARTIWVHRIILQRGEKPVAHSNLITITPDMPEDSLTSDIIRKWSEYSRSMLAREAGFDERIIAKTDLRLDAREREVRRLPTLFGTHLAQAAIEAFPGAQMAFINSGSIRYDEVITGSITAADIAKALPFGGKLALLEMKGKEVIRLLEVGEKNKNSGGYLQKAGVFAGKNGWVCCEKPVMPDVIFRVVVTEYMSSGKEKGMDFLGEIASQIPDTLSDRQTPNDIRQIMLKKLSRDFPVTP